MDAAKIALFWSRVDKTDGCWLWAGTRLSHGYGAFCVNGRNVRAHRISWELTHGPIDNDLCVLHRCDNRPCVRPDHLFLGTHGDNAADRASKRRSAPQSGASNHYAKLTSEDVAAIRALLAAHVLQREIAAQFNVNRSTISAIAIGRSWSV